jgi:type IV secretion system protein VirD4
MKVRPIVITAGWALVVVAGLAAAALLWSANYAAAVCFVSGQSNIWSGFASGALWLPALQAWTWANLPVVHKLVTLATAAIGVEAAILGGGVYLFVAMPWKARPPAEGARLATLSDLQRAKLLDGEPGRSLLLGTFKGRDVRYDGPSHFYVNGPSRSGKGRGFILPNLLEWSGSAIVFDPKQENCDLTAQARIALGQKVYLISPGSRNSHRWNPLDFVRPWPERATDLANMAASLIDLPKQEPHWALTARNILTGLLGYVLDSQTMEGRRNIRSALRMFSTGKNLADVFQLIVDEEPDLHPFILDAFRQHIARDPKQRPSFETNVTTALSAWHNSLFAEMTSASDFDIRELRRNPFTVFIAAPVSDFASAEPVIRLFIQQVHDILLRDLPGSDEPHKVLFILDEFYQFKRFPEIIDRSPLVAAYGFQIALIAQNIPQIDERYSKATREALLGNMDIKLFVAVGDKASGEVASEAMGKRMSRKQDGRRAIVLDPSQRGAARAAGSSFP